MNLIIISIVGILLMLYGFNAANSTIILVLGALLLIVAQYLIYTRVIKSKNKVDEALSSIDVQLKKRYDLIPNSLTIANKFMEHERGLLEEIERLRSQSAKLGSGDSNLSQKIQLPCLLQCRHIMKLKSIFALQEDFTILPLTN